MSKPTSTTAALRAIMEAYNLTRADICRILGLKPRAASGSTGTVDDWLRGATPVPRAKLELIHLKAPAYTRSAEHPRRAGPRVKPALEAK